jgi:hypothetical protein
MLKKIFGRRPDHPLADVREVRKMLEELPRDDPLKALEELSFWLDSVRSADSFRLTDQLAVLKSLDEAAQPITRHLGDKYRRASRMNLLEENRIWLVSFEFWKRVAAAYLHCIEQFEERVPGAEAIRGDLVLISTRAVRALAQQNKWLYARYRPYDERIWTELAHLYLLAQAQSFGRSLVTAYPGEAVKTTLVQEYLRALMLAVSAPDGLTPEQIEMADRVVTLFGGAFTLAETPQQDSMFYVDLSGRQPPARLIKGTLLNAAMRFLSSGNAAKKLEALAAQIRQGMALTGTGLEEFDRHSLLEVLDSLQDYWAAEPAQRRFLRKKVVLRVQVVHGFKEIRRKIASLERSAVSGEPGNRDILYQERLDLKLYGFVTEKTKRTMAEAATRAVATEKEEEATESWLVENISECGYGAVIQNVGQDWVRVGMLIGMKPEGSQKWVVGVVRRLTRDRRHQVYVGIQAIDREAISARLRPVGASVSAWDLTGDTMVHDIVPAFVLVRAPHCVGEENTLLLEKGTFAVGKSYDLLMSAGARTIRLEKLLEEGVDFQRVSFLEISA